MEYKSFKFEVKEINDEDKEFFVFTGYASTFGNVDRGGDIVAPGAFTESLTKIKPVLLWQHDMSEPLGVLDSANEDAKGLLIEARMPKEDKFVSERVIPQIKIGSIVSMSIGFNIIVREWDDETDVRTIKKVDLFEISLVSIPMNAEARLTGFKSKDAIKEKYKTLFEGDNKNTNLNVVFDNFNQLKDVSSFLKDFGFSNSEANSLIHNLKKVINKKDQEELLSKEIKALTEHIKGKG